MGRWRIERDYQELKSELGLHHYEGRNFVAFTITRVCASLPTAF
jgi:SRSO17 transposase